MGPWAFVVVTLGAYRLWRIAARDSITEKAREAITGFPDEAAPPLKAAHEDAERHEPGTVRDSILLPSNDWAVYAAAAPRWRVYLSALIRCPWCLGFYIAVVSYAGWRAWPELTLTIATPLAISAALGIIRKNLDP